jgi:hypothetical protein
MPCQSDNKCKAYRYNKWRRQCSIKSMTGQLRFEPSSVAGILASAKMLGVLISTGVNAAHFHESFQRHLVAACIERQIGVLSITCWPGAGR